MRDGVPLEKKAMLCANHTDQVRFEESTMKRTPQFLLLAVIALLSIGARSIMEEDYPIPPESVEKIVGEGIWYYTWPHGLLPLEPKGYNLVSGPFDYTTRTKGKTMEHWGMKATYGFKRDDIQFSAWVLQGMSQKDRALFSHPAGPIWGAEQQVDSRVVKFHNLKAGIGVLQHKDAPEQKPDRHGRIQAPRTVFLVLRMEDKLFLFCSRDLAPIENIEETLLSFAEQVYQRNIDNRKE
jgi:hypothetical protein